MRSPIPRPWHPAVFLLLLLGCPQALASTEAARQLWSSVTAARPPALEEPEWRGRTVALVDPERLVQAQRGRFELELFDGERLLVDLVRREVPRPGAAVWYGELGLPDSGDRLMLATTRGAAAATLWYQGRLLRLRGPAGALILSELDPAGFDPCGTGAEHAIGTGTKRGPASEPPAPDELPGLPASQTIHTIDVLTLWTPQARNGAGGLSAIQALVDLAVAETNQSLENCDAGARVRLVHAVETEYVESGNMSTDLSRLRSTSNSHMSEVHGLRNQYGADVVALITNTGSYCGVAYLMTNVSPSFQSSAFSVTRRSCATGNLTYGHELGHNFGCAHDPDNAGGASRPFAYGYRTPNSQHRTVMAYSPGARRPLFSSPLHTWGGWPMGVHNSNDNARAITLNAPTIAAWRPTMVGEENWESYCVTSPNSNGGGALMLASGTTSIADNSFVLEGVGAIPNKFGLFYYGAGQVEAPFGDGVRCVGAGGIGTFRLSPPQLPSAFGDFVRPLDLGAPPANAGAGEIKPGSTWNFQLWYRDPGGPGGSGFNLSDGLSATFSL